MKDIIKRKKKLIIALSICVILVLALCIAYEVIFANNSGKYGNRLEGIQKVNITKTQQKKIKDNIETLEISKSVSVYLTGKILKTVVVLKDDVALDKSKETYVKLLEQLTDKQKKYFDIEIFLEKKVKDESFPIIGYKHHNKENVSWTNR